MAGTDDHTPPGVQRCVDEIRRLIFTGQLPPGQKVHQGELASQLNVSRIPIREALSTLQAEGVLVHKPNTGFAVARFSAEDLSEIYLMRRLLETELLRSIDLAAVDVAELIRLSHALKAIDCRSDIDLSTFQDGNTDFHFRIFEYSPLTLVRREVQRLWNMSRFYRSMYLNEPDSVTKVHADHEHIIGAIRQQDADELVRASDEHRASTQDVVVRRLRWWLRR